jgi:4-hydroxybenzoate polyprenyltransferase
MLVHPSRFALYLNLIRWDRPAGTYLLLWPTLCALFFAARGFPGWHLLSVFVLGTFLMRSAGCVINDVADRHIDKHVQRTAQRPVTTGAIGVRAALILACILALLAFALVLTTNTLTVACSLGALLVSVLYPFTKRFFAMPQAVLGVAFGFGIPMAFAAVQGTIPILAALLAAGNLCWVLAYDTQYAMVDRADDIKIGIKTSAITLGRFDVLMIMVCYVLFVTTWAVAGYIQALRWPYFAGLGAAALQAAWHYRLIRQRSREGCLQAFQLNHWLGLVILLGLLFSIFSF